MSAKPTKSDDTVEIVAQARAFSAQFGALLKVAGMLDEVGSLRQELEDLKGQREKALHELNILFGERDAELKALTQQIEDRVRGEHAEAEQVRQNEAELRKSVASLNEEVQDRRKKLTSMEQQLVRTEALYGEVHSKLAGLRGAIPA